MTDQHNELKPISEPGEFLSRDGNKVTIARRHHLNKSIWTGIYYTPHGNKVLSCWNNDGSTYGVEVEHPWDVVARNTRAEPRPAEEVPTNQKPRKEGDAEMNSGDKPVYVGRPLKTPGEASNPPAGEPTSKPGLQVQEAIRVLLSESTGKRLTEEKMLHLIKMGDLVIHGFSFQIGEHQIGILDRSACRWFKKSEFWEMMHPPTDGLQVQVSERHRECARELEAPPKKTPCGTGYLVEYPVFEEIVAKHFPDQSAEIKELRERNDWLEGQREIAIKQKDDAEEVYREASAEIERLRAENSELSNHIAIGRAWNSPDSLLLENKQLRERVKVLEQENKNLKENQEKLIDLNVSKTHANNVLRNRLKLIEKSMEKQITPYGRKM